MKDPRYTALSDRDIYMFNLDALYGLSKLKDHSMGMVLADLPFGYTRCKWDLPIPLELLWEQLERVVKPDRAIVLNAGAPFNFKLYSSNADQYRYTWYWDKVFGANFSQAKRTPIRTVEEVLVFSTGSKTPHYNPQMEKRDKPIYKGGNKQSEAIPIAITEASAAFGKQKKRYDEKNPVNLLRFDVRMDRPEMKAKGLKGHPTQKPVALNEYLIRTYSREGEMVLDVCFGSGSTAMAALRSGRRFIGFENDDEHGYYEMALQRLFLEL